MSQTIKLYFSPGACSLAPHILLEETGLQYTTEKVDLKSHKVGERDYYAVNKKGSVPVLEFSDGERLTEAAVINQYIADQKPESRLIPAAGNFERYRIQEWLNFVATELHKGFGPLFNPSMPPEAKSLAKANLAKKFDLVAERLNGRSYLMGDQFTAADAYLFVPLTWAAKFEIDLAKWPALAAFRDRVKARPAVQTVMKSEGLI